VKQKLGKRNYPFRESILVPNQRMAVNDWKANQTWNTVGPRPGGISETIDGYSVYDQEAENFVKRLKSRFPVADSKADQDMHKKSTEVRASVLQKVEEFKNKSIEIRSSLVTFMKGDGKDEDPFKVRSENIGYFGQDKLLEGLVRLENYQDPLPKAVHIHNYDSEGLVVEGFVFKKDAAYFRVNVLQFRK